MNIKDCKNVFRQLKKNPKIEVVFFAPDANQMELYSIIRNHIKRS